MTPAEPLPTLIQDFELYLIAAAFALARMTGLMLVMPVFSRVRLAGILRNGVALALSLPLIPMIVGTLERSDIGVTLVLAYLIKELVVGATLGLAMGIPFWAAESAGEILDLQRGSTMSGLIDPMATHETSATGTLLAIIMIALYFAAGGLELTLNGLYDSYSLWPVDQLFPVFNDKAAWVFLGLLTQILAMALTMVFPLIVGMLLSDLVLAFLARASPSLNVFALSLIVKTLIFSLVFVLYAAFLTAYMSRDLGFLRNSQQLIETIGCRDCR